MGRNVTYTCDRCSSTHTDQNQLWEVVVGLKWMGQMQSGTFLEEPRPKAMWCRKCTEEFSALHGKEKLKPPDPEVKGIEELLREFIREEAREVAFDEIQTHLRNNQ